jgi:hypothetical protein
MQKPEITPTRIVCAWRVPIGQYRMASLRIRAKIIPTGCGTDERSEERASAALAAPRVSDHGAEGTGRASCWVIQDRSGLLPFAQFIILCSTLNLAVA